MNRGNYIALILLLFFPLLLNGGQERKLLMWFDATANFARLSDRDSVRYYLHRIVQLGFTDAVVDVKPITGEVLFPSSYAPLMREWNGFTRKEPEQFLAHFIEDAHQAGLRVHASLNIFSAGHNFFDRGRVYSDHPEWASIVHTDSGMMPITRVRSKYSAMTNPANPNVREHELKLLEELVRLYPTLDGIILDRVRFDGICADFSPVTRAAFERKIGHPVKNFPRDIFEWKRDSAGNSVRSDGPLFNRWIEFRAELISSFMTEARQRVKAVRKNISFGDYTGAWYPLYYEVGVNWASRSYDPSAEYTWATKNYKNTGYAEQLDLYTTGNYYFEVTKEELLTGPKTARTESGLVIKKEPWYSVEGSNELVRHVLNGALPFYGGIYVEQYAGHPEQFSRAVAMNIEKSDGLMVFDIVHIIQQGWWEALQNGITKGLGKETISR